MGSTGVAVCGVNSAGCRYNNAGIAAWRILDGSLLYSFVPLVLALS